MWGKPSMERFLKWHWRLSSTDNRLPTNCTKLPRRNGLFLPHLSSLALHLSLSDKHSLTRQVNVSSRVCLKLHHWISACRYHVCMCSVDAWHTSISRKGIWREGQYRTKASLIKAHWRDQIHTNHIHVQAESKSFESRMYPPIPTVTSKH